MSERLKELATRVARELAAREQVVARGAPPEKQDRTTARSDPHHSSASPSISSPGAALATPQTGVRFIRQNARIADFIDHTLLKAEATRGDIETLCAEARDHHFATVCVNPVWVAHCASRLTGSGVGIATVVGFPLGATDTRTKRAEASLAVDEGATEVDMVAAIGHIKSGDWDHVASDIRAVVEGAQERVVKVIIESAALTPVEIIKASALAKECGAHYVKTSTGFHAAGGASAEAVALMRLVVGDALGVKASGGVRDCATALRMIASGATRIGTSSGVSMAECLGLGPLPLAEILSLVASHGARCVTCHDPPGPDTRPEGRTAY